MQYKLHQICVCLYHYRKVDFWREYHIEQGTIQEGEFLYNTFLLIDAQEYPTSAYFLTMSDLKLAFSLSERFLKLMSKVKGIGGGVKPKKIDFVHFNICCTPIFLLSKMGSYVSQLSKLFILQAIT